MELHKRYRVVQENRPALVRQRVTGQKMVITGNTSEADIVFQSIGSRRK